MLDALTDTLGPLLTQALAAILTAAVPAVVAWLRLRTQRLVVQAATEEAERCGHEEGLPPHEKKAMAVTLSSERMGALTRPSPERLDHMIEEAVPRAKITVPPPE